MPNAQRNGEFGLQGSTTATVDPTRIHQFLHYYREGKSTCPTFPGLPVLLVEVLLLAENKEGGGGGGAGGMAPGGQRRASP